MNGGEPERRGVGVLVALVLVGLAGCSGVAPPASPTGTATPAPVPTEPPTPTPVPLLAPGVTDGGVRNAAELASAHRAVLADTSYTERVVEVRRYPNGTLARRSVRTRRVAGNDSRYRETIAVRDAERRTSGDGSRLERYREGGRTYLAVMGADGPRYRRVPGRVAHRPGLPFVLLSARESRVVGQVHRDGDTLHRVEVDRAVDPTLVATYSLPGRYAPAWNLTLAALVDRRGLIHEFRMTYTAGDGDGPGVRVTRSVSYLAVGNTTVDRPAWYGEAVANTSAGRP